MSTDLAPRVAQRVEARRVQLRLQLAVAEAVAAEADVAGALHHRPRVREQQDGAVGELARAELLAGGDHLGR